MKIVTQEEIDDHTNATIRGAAEGAAFSAALAIPSWLILNRRWAYFRALPPPLKLMGTVMLVAPCVSIQAERRGLAFDRAHWTGAGRMELDREAAEAEAQWNALSTKQKIGDWASRHQYSIIVGSWVLSMAVAGGIVARDRHQTLPQKVVQVRMWAQGLTIGVLIAAGALTHTQRQAALQHRPVDHSWRTLLAEQAREDDERKVRLNSLSSSSPL
ncbi:uncharacterized protein EDB91DRAFT_1057155 [Suillus paluster]|uniref:uncharacterized protein n=1 Tax=Suillus paluster TaxID=48578 RepID=UPI001B8795B7|nr:uncharacterized protein EDB91DRAFT_1057155 [Suillus paluster]KAG1733925.1 hypothetical protein EDB91DRAFT_1057155 [Suillus paluster]